MGLRLEKSSKGDNDGNKFESIKNGPNDYVLLILMNERRNRGWG